MTKKEIESKLNIVFANSDIEAFDIQTFNNLEYVFALIRKKNSENIGLLIQLLIENNEVYFFLDEKKIKVGVFRRISTKSQVLTFDRNSKFWETLAKILLQ